MRDNFRICRGRATKHTKIHEGPEESRKLAVQEQKIGHSDGKINDGERYTNQCKRYVYLAFLSPAYLAGSAMIFCYIWLIALVYKNPNYVQELKFHPMFGVAVTLIWLAWSARIIKKTKCTAIIASRNSIYITDFKRRLRYDQIESCVYDRFPGGLEAIRIKKEWLRPGERRMTFYFQICFIPIFSSVRDIHLKGLSHVGN